MVKLADLTEIPMIWWDDYEMPLYFRRVTFHEEERCQICYTIRLSKTAEVAKKEGFDKFSTTLLVSPYQKHEIIKEIGCSIAKRFELTFHYEDFRIGWPERDLLAREYDLYRQNYCGCLYSEWERLQKIRARKDRLALNR